MADFGRSSALARSVAGGMTGDLFVDSTDVRVHTVDAAQMVIAVHLEAGGGPPPGALLDSPAGVTGHALPAAPNTRNGSNDDYSVWLDPARWLAVCPPGQRWSRFSDLQAAIARASSDAFVSDASDALLVLDITGARAAELMTMACALDIGLPGFAAPRTARTGFAGAGGALLYRYRDGFRVHVDATLTAHVREWLELAVRLLPRRSR